VPRWKEENNKEIEIFSPAVAAAVVVRFRPDTLSCIMI
jgi:hypothetical protein